MEHQERGASAVEYALIIAGITLVIIAAVYFFGESVLGLFQDACDEIDSASSDYSCDEPES